ncbi:hypothetical protein JHK87_011107 [Glycine soja]|nr:hypothetical protein JHK87_011107 [Glycine soja]
MLPFIGVTAKVVSRETLTYFMVVMINVLISIILLIISAIILRALTVPVAIYNVVFHETLNNSP